MRHGRRVVGRVVRGPLRRLARRAHERDAHTRRVTRLFDDYQHWAKEAMTTAKTPFLQVIAVLCHAEGDFVKAADGEVAR